MTSKSHFLKFLLYISAASGCAANPPTTDAFDAGFENSSGLTFSPDGKTAYWASWNGKWGADGKTPRQIFFTSQQDGNWSTVSAMSFGGNHNDDDPFVSPDGKWLYFVSDRPTSQSDSDRDTNIWRFSLGDDVRLEQVTVNSNASEYSPVVVSSGALYFASDREGGRGRGDIYRALPEADGFNAPKALGESINSKFGEWNVWVSSDETEIIFEASSRPTNVSIPGDLYYSRRAESGWADAIPIAALNTKNSDLMPRLHPAGSYLYYTSAPIGGHAELLMTNWSKLRKQLRYSVRQEL